MINSRIIELESRLVNLVNSSELPPAIISLILSRIESQVSDLTRQTVAQEKKQANQEMIKEEIDNEENSK